MKSWLLTGKALNPVESSERSGQQMVVIGILNDTDSLDTVS